MSKIGIIGDADSVLGFKAVSYTHLIKGECKYCKYNSICRFDITYKGNRYREVDG